MSSIDVVVPCYKYGRFLRQCVESVLAQAVAGLRIFIIDDASPDNTLSVGLALAAKDSRVTYRRHAANRGHTATFNEGVDWCKADYMLLISADDYLLPGALRRATALMDAHPEVGLCFGLAVTRHADGSFTPNSLNSGPCGVLSGEDLVGLMLANAGSNVVCAPTAVIRTWLLKDLGGYRVDLPHTNDLEMWLRLSAHAAVGFVRANQAVYRQHSANMSSGYFRDYCMPDLQQRWAALEAFRAYGAECLYRALLAALARAAVGHASSALSGGRADLSRELQALAVEMWPGVRRTAVWSKLKLKEVLGLRVTAALLAVLKSV